MATFSPFAPGARKPGLAAPGAPSAAKPVSPEHGDGAAPQPGPREVDTVQAAGQGGAASSVRSQFPFGLARSSETRRTSEEQPTPSTETAAPPALRAAPLTPRTAGGQFPARSPFQTATSAAVARLDPSNTPLANRAIPRGLTPMAAPDDAEPATERRPSGLTPAKTDSPAPVPRARGGLTPVSTPKYIPQQIGYDEDQLEVIRSKSKITVGNAFAGAGKTTVSVGWAEVRSHLYTLYVCLNEANAKEAQKRFPPHVVAKTWHSVAKAAMKVPKSKICDKWKPMVVKEALNLNSARDAMLAMKVLEAFFSSRDTAISHKHVAKLMEEKRLKPEVANEAVVTARLAWQRMMDPKDAMQMPHDAYLKAFALKAPPIPYKAIINDEGQDANAVTGQIIEGLLEQLDQLLIVGDTHQSIYAFRGSVDLMGELAKRPDACVVKMRRTWRFGPKVAEMANLLLQEFKGETVKIIGMGEDKPFDPTRVAYLTRTNAELFRQAASRNGEGVHWAGCDGSMPDEDETRQEAMVRQINDRYRLSLVMDAYSLWIRDRDSIIDPLIRKNFASWDEYVSYAESSNDSEAKVMVSVVEEFKDRVPQLLADIRKNAVADKHAAALTLSTAHRSKGMEFDNVIIGEDFQVLAEAEERLADGRPDKLDLQSIHLLYVAFTRAKHALQLNTETKEWLANLPEHREDRRRAAEHIARAQQMARQRANHRDAA